MSEVNRAAPVAVVGAGTMGCGIVQVFAQAGFTVRVLDASQPAIDNALALIRKQLDRGVQKERITAADADAANQRIHPASSYDEFADAQLCIEAASERPDVKKDIFRAVDAVLAEDAIRATNTSSISITEWAVLTKCPGRVIGMHFFSPANVMKMLEVVRGDKTSKTVIATAMSVAKRINKVPVLVGVCHGFVGNRMLFMRRIEADRMILEGARPAQVDRVLFDFGFPMGPFAMSDLAGLDIGWKAETSTGDTVRDIMNESGRKGQKNGRGYYTYDAETRASTPDPEVESMIRDFAIGKGIEQRDITDEEVLERCLFPMINEGAKILEEGIAIRGSDIDVVWVNGYGWPVYRGGPMYWADSLGLGEVADKIEAYGARLDGAHWELSPHLRSLADEGGSLH